MRLPGGLVFSAGVLVMGWDFLMTLSRRNEYRWSPSRIGLMREGVTAVRAKSGSELLALRKRRMAASPPVFRGGFRPFFLAAGLWAVLAMLLWICALEGVAALPRGIDPLAWHRHEMLFGFAGAAVAGFLLTAIPNWTGRLPIAGAPLAGLVCLWAAARAAILLVPARALILAALLDSGLFLLLSGFAVREVLAAKSRNLAVAMLVLLLGAADALDYLGIAGRLGDPLLGMRAGLSILMLMISVIGGRIVPSFTRNWMAKREAPGSLPTQPGRFDLAVIAATAAALLLWILLPDARVTGSALVAAGLAQAMRLARWRGWATFGNRLLVVLHVGYAWLAAGLALLGASILSVDVPRSAAIHAVGAGAIATMILAVMSRASLGHTGRALRAARPTVAAFALISLAAFARVATAFGWLEPSLGLRLAAAFWVAAFALFLIVYIPILTKPRLGESPP